MKFKSITLQGFKSFPERTTIEFHEGITTIVGPNGSGKSNITDAIRWVLGEQSAKTLRGSRMEDVIFSGTANRRALSYSEVVLTMDNSDSALDIPYEEVEVRRRLYRSGESEYSLNKSKCRLKDIVELFMDSGIGRDGYSLVGQGRIDEVLSTKSEDRRNIFDEAAGIAKFRSRKEEADSKLLRTEQNLQRVQDIQREIDLHLKPLEIQAKKAIEYLKLKERKEYLDKNRLFYEIDEHKINIKVLADKLDIANANLSQQKNVRDDFVQENEKKKEELNILSKSRDEYRDKRDKLNSELNNLDYKIKFNEDTEKSELRRKRELLDDIERENFRIDKLKRDINENISYNEDNDTIKKLESEFDSAEKYLKELSLNNIQAQNNLNQKKFEVEQLNKLIDKNNNEIVNKKNKINTILDFQNTLKKIKSSDINKEKSLKDEVKLFNEKLKCLEDKKTNLNASIKGQVDEYNTINSRLDNINNQINIVNEKLRDSEYRFKSLNQLIESNTGLQQSVKSLLDYIKEKNLSFDKKLIHGPLANLIKVDERYEKAIDTALGNNLQNIVVETEKVASYLIDILRSKHLGRATFLPIDAITTRTIDYSTVQEAKKVNGFIALASDLVECPNKFLSCIEYRLGRIFICEDLEAAQVLSKRLNRKFQIVTLEGDLIAAGGAITGGFKNKNSQGLGLLERQRERNELNKKIKKLNEELNDLKNTEAAFSHSKNNLELNLKDLSKQDKELDSEILTLQTKLQIAETELLSIQKRISDDKNDEYKLELINIEKEIEQCQEQIETSLKLRETSLRETEVLQKDYSEQEKALHEFKENYDHLRLELSVKKSELDSKKEMILKWKTEVDELETLLNYKKNECELTEQKLNLLTKEKNDLNDDYKKKYQIFTELNDLYLVFCRKYEEAEANNVDFLTKLSELVNEQELLQRECSRLETQLEQSKNKERDMLNELWENYELTYYDSEKFNLSDFNLIECKKELKDIKFALAKIGPVNENAATEYEELKERYDFINKQHSDILTARIDLEKLIQSISEEMRIQFKDSFYFINEQFNEVFQELFGGGYAELILSGDDVLEADIQIRVCPPGKKLQNMLLLSGGERCLAAIALLFAIQRLKPTAFCVLDEVEAALDDANIFRFVKYLHNYAKKTQFIIVTHRKGTMEASDRIYGVSMPEKGISKVLSLNLEAISTKVE